MNRIPPQGPSLSPGALLAPQAETEEALLAFPELKELAADAATLELPAARAMLAADLAARWKRGEGLPAEVYWDLAGDWGDDETLWLLASTELSAQQSSETKPELDAWVARFPLIAARLTEFWHELAPAPVAPVTDATAAPAIDELAPRTPERIAEFEVLLELPSPGRNRWFAVRDPQQQRELVLELGCETIAVSHPWRERIEHDLRETAALDAPQLPKVQAWGWDSDRPFVVREYVAGVSLPDWIRYQHAEPAKVLSVIGAVAKVLAMAHRRGVLHLALTPRHLVVDERGRPHLLGLGTGLLEIANPGSSEVAPPELIETAADRCGPRTDIYSLGAVLAELLTGQPPRGESDPSLDSLDDDLRRICSRALRSDPKERFASADDFAIELEALGRHDEMLGRMLIPSFAAIGGVVLIAALTWLYQSGALAAWLP